MEQRSMTPDDLSLKTFASDSWRIFRIISEFVEGFEAMTSIGPSVSIFGSARLSMESEYYALTQEIAKLLVQKDFAIITGGGPGLMEAANRGAQDAKGASCGLSITLPSEELSNSYIDSRYSLHFRYFFVRKVMFIRYAQGYIFMPGGFGTLDELFEALTLIQTKKICAFPIYLVGCSYWQGLLDWIKQKAITMGCLADDDLTLVHMTDNPREIADGIERHYQRNRYERNF
jgi:hypothetical protein